MKKQLHPGARWLFRVRVYPLVIIILWLSLVFGRSSIDALVAGWDDFIISLFTSTIVAYLLFVLVVAEIYARLAYNRWFYEFTNHELKTERGIIWKRYTNVPYDRVQNVDVTRGILARIFGFSTVNIQTAGYHYQRSFGGFSEGYIPAVEIGEAEKIRGFVLKKIGRRKGGL